MDLEQIMQMNTFAVVGDTLNPEKYAYKIKEGLLEQGYTVYSVGKELASTRSPVIWTSSTCASTRPRGSSCCRSAKSPSAAL